MNEKIYFKNKKGLKLCGIISNPTGNNMKPIVILCHGHSTGKDSSTNKALEKVLNDSNVSTFRFDFSGHGESEGNFEEINISDAVSDIFSAIEYLKSLNYSKIGLEGSSFGGISAIMVASKISNLFVLALKCPAIDYYQEEFNVRGEEAMKDWKEKGITQYEEGRELNLKFSFVEDFANNDAFIAGKKISAPTLIVLGDKDEYIPVSEAAKLSKIIKDCHLEIFPDADHKFSKLEDFERMIQVISDFIVKKSK
jgi:alpha/beta superfamily hydrolase